MTMKNKLLYPYGAETLSEEFLAREEVHYYDERSCKLGTDLPLRHPLLTAIPQEFTLQKVLPTWWSDALPHMDFHHAILLKSVTPDQFYIGNVDEQLVKKLRAMMSPDEKKEVPQSPSIAKWLEPYPTLLKKFNDRGGTDNGELIGKIVSIPSETFYMSNGKGWSSCQHWKGSYATRLMGTMFDPYAVLATIQKKGVAINEYINKRGESGDTEKGGGTLYARAVLRLMYFLDRPYIFIDRVYGQDTGTINVFIKQIYRHLVDSGCSPTLSGHAPYPEILSSGYIERELESKMIVTRDDVPEPYHDSLRVSSSYYFTLGTRGLKQRRYNGTSYIATTYADYE